MNKKAKNKNLSTYAIRWIARIVGLVLIFIGISIFIQSGIQNPLSLGATNLILNLCFLIMMIGILLGFKWEITGGAVIIGGFIVFWIFSIINTGNIRLGWILPLFPIIGAFFLICGLRSKKQS